VRVAVDFDYEARFHGCEVRDVRTDRMLAAEFMSGEGAAPQPRPQDHLGLRHLSA
jgi:hypothetical protein